jgi:hypothetical protein
MITPLAEAMRDAIVMANKMGQLYTPPDAKRPVVYMALQGKLQLVVLPTSFTVPACMLLWILSAAPGGPWCVHPAATVPTLVVRCHMLMAQHHLRLTDALPAPCFAL